MITAPYNFVPLNDKVFYPSWGDDVSHDIPFEDGESGEISIEIEAKSPIFIRDSKDEERFCNHNKQYYIPGSSIKGMVRNVLEIMSFSKMSFVNDDTYAVRDLRNRELYMSKMIPENTFCGWLKKTKDGYIIEDCGKPGRIKHSEIDKIFNIDFASKFIAGKFGNKVKDKIAEKKYKLIGEDKSFEHNFTYVKKDVNREIYKYDKNSIEKGTLVLTGQPSARKEPEGQKPSGKVYEFIFFEPKNELKLSKDIFDNFLFAYFDKRDTEPKESADWAFWKEKLYNGEKIPVFFQKNGNKILHFGLSYLYKLPYKYSIKDGIYDTHLDDRIDLAQTIFGYISKSNKSSLKGRVNFSHFKAMQNIKELNPRTEILGTPRASYYPIYIKQQDGNLYTTMMDNDFKIAGWKRYPIHKDLFVKKTEDTGNDNVGTTFTPLKEGVVFKGKLRYHNLKKAELGAILSALTFHNTPNTYHNIGLAKSLGYGKIKIKIDGIEDIQSYLKEFELYVTEQILNWKDSVQLKELITMATEQNNSGNSKLEYMKLEQFANNKTGDDKDYLRNYSNLNNIEVRTIQSLISNDDLEELERKNQAYLKQQEIYQQEQKKKQEHNQEWEIVQTTNNIDLVKAFIVKYEDYSPYIQNAQGKIKEIEELKAQEKEQKAQQEANEKWEAVLKVEDKFKQKALEDFIKRYSTSSYISQAKELLDTFTTKTKSSKDIIELNNAKDAASFKKVLESLDDIASEDKEIIKQNAIRIYTSLKGKKQKNFFKEVQIARFVDKDFEGEVKSQI